MLRFLQSNGRKLADALFVAAMSDDVESVRDLLALGANPTRKIRGGLPIEKVRSVEALKCFEVVGVDKIFHGTEIMKTALILNLKDLGSYLIRCDYRVEGQAFQHALRHYSVTEADSQATITAIFDQWFDKVVENGVPAHAVLDDICKWCIEGGFDYGALRCLKVGVGSINVSLRKLFERDMTQSINWIFDNVPHLVKVNEWLSFSAVVHSTDFPTLERLFDFGSPVDTGVNQSFGYSTLLERALRWPEAAEMLLARSKSWGDQVRAARTCLTEHPRSLWHQTFAKKILSNCPPDQRVNVAQFLCTQVSGSAGYGEAGELERCAFVCEVLGVSPKQVDAHTSIIANYLNRVLGKRSEDRIQQELEKAVEYGFVVGCKGLYALGITAKTTANKSFGRVANYIVSLKPEVSCLRARVGPAQVSGLETLLTDGYRGKLPAPVMTYLQKQMPQEVERAVRKRQ
jgi:hypothetical protein